VGRPETAQGWGDYLKYQQSFSKKRKGKKRKSKKKDFIRLHFPCNHLRTTPLTPGGTTPLPLSPPPSSVTTPPVVCFSFCFFALILERTVGEEYAASIRSVASSSRSGTLIFEGAGVFEGEASDGFCSNFRTHYVGKAKKGKKS